MKKQLLKLSAIAAGLFLFAGIVSAQHTKPLQATLVIPSLNVVGSAHETMTMDGAADEASYGAENAVTWCWNPSSGIIAARDLGGFFKVCYDKQNLYLFCKITDDTAGIYPAGNPDPYNFDNVELFIDMDSTINLVSNLGSYNQSTHADTTTDANQYRWNRQVSDSSTGNKARNGKSLNTIGESDPGTFWTVEVAVPWMATMPTAATIESLNAWFAQTIGFDISFADNDAAAGVENRTGQLAWESDTSAAGSKAESDQAWHDTRDFGFASFEAIPVINAIKTIDNTSINMYPVPATNVLNIANLDGANSIDFVNSLGQSVLTVSSINASSVAVNVSNLTSGVYMVRINMNNGDVVTGKMVR
jgi:hypothetical protein